MAAVKPSNLAPSHWDRSGLPPWTYFSEELLEIEKEELFRKHWQLACHVSDVPEPGSYVALDIAGERALILKGTDGRARAFHNVCRHRGSRVVADDKGRCKSAVVCPFHGWSYNLDGTLRQPAQAHTLPDLDPVAFGLKPTEMEIWNGFVFIRFKP
ncbi:MAG: Rieske (2Fe-2S) protein, partial [Gammaproteobacteria bacterium]|nr:Rieske (2Fe-2S) protein [Gammaproteobacteria bacterium]